MHFLNNSVAGTGTKFGLISCIYFIYEKSLMILIQNLLYIFIGLDITVIGIINNFASLFIYLKIFFLIDIILQIKNIILKIIFIIYIIGNLFINKIKKWRKV